MIQIILTHHWPAGLLFPFNFVSAHFTNREWIQLLWGNLEPLNHIQINLALGFVTLSGQTTSTTSSLRRHSLRHTFTDILYITSDMHLYENWVSNSQWGVRFQCTGVIWEENIYYETITYLLCVWQPNLKHQCKKLVTLDDVLLINIT